jgi:hypothetical protein
MLLFGVLIYIIDNSESESNIRNILGKFYLNLILKNSKYFKMDFGLLLLH